MDSEAAGYSPSAKIGATHVSLLVLCRVNTWLRAGAGHILAFIPHGREDICKACSSSPSVWGCDYKMDVKLNHSPRPELFSLPGLLIDFLGCPPRRLGVPNTRDSVECPTQRLPVVPNPRDSLERSAQFSTLPETPNLPWTAQAAETPSHQPGGGG